MPRGAPARTSAPAEPRRLARPGAARRLPSSSGSTASDRRSCAAGRSSGPDRRRGRPGCGRDWTRSSACRSIARRDFRRPICRRASSSGIEARARSAGAFPSRRCGEPAASGVVLQHSWIDRGHRSTSSSTTGRRPTRGTTHRVGCGVGYDERACGLGPTWRKAWSPSAGAGCSHISRPAMPTRLDDSTPPRSPSRPPMSCSA